MSGFWKIALGVGCGILLAVGVLVFACTGFLATVGMEMADQEQEKQAALADLVVEDLSDETRSGFTTIRGKVRNTGSKPVTYVKVEVELRDSAGRVIDSGWTYAVSGTPLNPGSATSWDVMLSEDSRFDKYRARVIP